jgi:hypothetical protein
MKYANEMGLGAMVYIPSFIKIGSAIHRLIRGDTQAHGQHRDCIHLLSLFKSKESRQKVELNKQAVTKWSHNSANLQHFGVAKGVEI